MAYMNQAKKIELLPGIKTVLKNYGMKGSVSVRDYAVLEVTLTEGPMELPQGRQITCVRPYIENYTNFYAEKTTKFLEELIDAMNGAGTLQNHDRSDVYTDYFDVGWYVMVHVGKWNKPYKLTA